MFRLFKERQVESMTKGHINMGRMFARNGNFMTPEATKFTGVERYPWLVRQMLTGILLKFIVNPKFDKFAKEWGCVTPLDVKVYSNKEAK